MNVLDDETIWQTMYYGEQLKEFEYLREEGDVCEVLRGREQRSA